MDLLKLIKEKANHFSNSSEDRGVLNIINHIEIAEKHFESGKRENEYYFNDVIYRSNQAFEGILKEAYRIIKNKNIDNLTPYKIEKYFENEKILKDRVLTLFTNYRMEWRNKSTHDYTLVFTEQEAFLAIVSISAFINILLDQMLEVRAYNIELKELNKNQLKEEKIELDKDLYTLIIDGLKTFSKNLKRYEKGTSIGRLFESELNGLLSAYLFNISKEIKVFSEYRIKSLHKIRIIDLLIMRKNEKVIIETKVTSKHSKSIIENGTLQLLSYMELSNVYFGILFIVKSSGERSFFIEKEEIFKGEKKFIITKIFSK